MSQYNRVTSPTIGAQQPMVRSRTKRQSMPGPLRKFLRTPKGVVLFLLAGLMLVACYHVSDRPGVVNVVAAVATASVIEIGRAHV